MGVVGQEQHHASHQSGTAHQRAMTLLIVSQVSARQALAEQRGLPKAEAETFTGNGVHSTRSVAHQHRAATKHAPQSSGDGDRASSVESGSRIFEGCQKMRNPLPTNEARSPS